jgi:DNA-binding XRE family transcriptional regulator
MEAALVRLEEARRRRGLSQSRLAAKADVSPRTIYNIERGLTRPQGRIAVAIAEALGMPAEDVDELRPAFEPPVRTEPREERDG